MNSQGYRQPLSIALAASVLLLSACMPAVDFEDDRALIEAEIAGSASAWNRGDLIGHLALYVPDVTFMTKTGPRPGVEAIEKAFREKYFDAGKPRQTLSFDHIVVRQLGPDSAMATGQFLLSGGGLEDQSGWYTLVWVRTEDGWRAVHDHSS